MLVTENNETKKIILNNYSYFYYLDNKGNKTKDYWWKGICYGKKVEVDTRKNEYESLLTALRKRMIRNSFYYKIDGHSPEDLFQAQSLVVVEKIRKYKPEKNASIHTFMCKCMDNKLNNMLRASKAKKRCLKIDGHYVTDIPLDSECAKYIKESLTDDSTNVKIRIFEELEEKINTNNTVMDMLIAQNDTSKEAVCLQIKKYSHIDGYSDQLCSFLLEQ